MADGKKSPKGRKIVVNFSWLYILLFIGIGWLLMRNQQSASPEKIEWTEVQSMIRSGDVAEITFIRNDFKGEIKVTLQSNLTGSPSMPTSLPAAIRRAVPRISTSWFPPSSIRR